MNLTGQAPHQKGKLKKRSKAALASHKRRWELIRALGCILTHMGVNHRCAGRITIHHCGTGGGGRKDHDRVVPLCLNMHTGADGIDGRQNFSKRTWQEAFATEDEMLIALAVIEGMP